MSVEWNGNPQALPQLRLAITRGLEAYMVIVGRSLRAQLSKKGSGRVYRIGAGRKRGKTLRARGYHRASAPGEPPAADTGLLRRSWQVGDGAVVRKYGREERLGIILGSPLKYARIEKRFGRVAARPYIMPTLKSVSDLFEPTMQRALKSWGAVK